MGVSLEIGGNRLAASSKAEPVVGCFRVNSSIWNSLMRVLFGLMRRKEGWIGKDK